MKKTITQINDEISRLDNSTITIKQFNRIAKNIRANHRLSNREQQRRINAYAKRISLVSLNRVRKTGRLVRTIE